MKGGRDFGSLLSGPGPLLALAPMQDITDLAFWRLLQRYGGADVYYTEYFRVHGTSHLEKWILKSIADNDTGRPVVAQLIGNDVVALARAARELQHYPVVAIDLNLGCPAPIVYRKCAGGGLLREPQKIDSILGALREAVTIPFTVKTRIGFDSPEGFGELLRLFKKHAVDLVAVHGRTVRELYRSEVHYEFIAQAAAALACPVLANGNIYSARKASQVLELTKARGLMIGRGAIRNPWIFEQIRQQQRGEAIRLPLGREVLEYVTALYEAVCSPQVSERAQVQHMKKYLNFLGIGVEPSGRFLHGMRRVTTRQGFFALCEEFLAHERPLALEPLPLALPEEDVVGGKQL